MELLKQILIVSLIVNISCRSDNKKEIVNTVKKESIDSLYVKGESDMKYNKQSISNNFMPDIKVNDLELVNPKSILNKVGGLEKITKEDKGLPYVSFVNIDKRLKLTLVSFPGSGYNDIYQFIIEQASGLDNEQVVQYENFITESNLKLGMKKSDIIKIKGNEYSSNKKDVTEIITYRIENYNSSSFLKKYNMPSYFMEFTLKDNIVVKIRFGFDYP